MSTVNKEDLLETIKQNLVNKLSELHTYKAYINTYLYISDNYQVVVELVQCTSRYKVCTMLPVISAIKKVLNKEHTAEIESRLCKHELFTIPNCYYTKNFIAVVPEVVKHFTVIYCSNAISKSGQLKHFIVPSVKFDTSNSTTKDMYSTTDVHKRKTAYTIYAIYNSLSESELDPNINIYIFHASLTDNSRVEIELIGCNSEDIEDMKHLKEKITSLLSIFIDIKTNARDKDKFAVPNNKYIQKYKNIQVCKKGTYSIIYPGDIYSTDKDILVST